MTHTKGKWDYIGDNNDGFYSVHTTNNNEADKGGDIAVVNPHRLRDASESRANAKLIASAPELLEALKEAKDLLTMRQTHQPHDSDWEKSVNMQITKAIKKAEGN